MPTPAESDLLVSVHCALSLCYTCLLSGSTLDSDPGLLPPWTVPSVERYAIPCRVCLAAAGARCGAVECVFPGVTYGTTAGFLIGFFFRLLACCAISSAVTVRPEQRQHRLEFFQVPVQC